MKHLKTFETNSNIEHKIYYIEFPKSKRITNTLNNIIYYINVMENNDIEYDIKYDIDFKYYMFYCYPKTHEDELIVRNELLVWYSWTGTVQKFRESLTRSLFDDILVKKDDIEMMIATNKFNL